MRKRSTALRIVGYTLVAFALLIAFYALIAFFAWQSGQAERAQRTETELRSAVERQFDLAAADVAAGNPDLAAQRINYLATLVPTDPRLLPLQATVAAQRAQSVGGAAASATPTATATATPPTASGDNPTATPPADPAPIVTLDSDPAVALAEIEAAIAAERWEDAIADLVAFQLAYPAYERYTTDTLLQEAYIGAGFYYTNRDRVSLGVTYFEQALKLGPIPDTARGQLNFSRAYLNALAYYGINWSIAIANLEQICPFAPQFQDSCARLVQARIAYGNQLMAAEQYCPAETQFAAALRVAESAEATSRLNAARGACASATPTPAYPPPASPTAEPAATAEQ